MKTLSFLIPVCLCAGLGACAVGPNFKAPVAPATDHYTAQPLPQQTTTTDVHGGEAQTFGIGEKLPSQWWTAFHSDKLNRLVAEAFANSPTVQAAEASLRQAGETYRADRTGLFPHFDGSATAERQKISEGAIGVPGADAGNATSIFNLYDTSVSVSYTLDVFGGIRRGIEQQGAVVDYQRFLLLGTYQTLAANVVTSAVEEASLRAQITATEQIIVAEETQLKVTTARFNVGGVSRADVLTARSSLASERASLPPLRKQLSATRNQLAVYLGKAPSEFVANDFDLAELSLPQDLPVSLPSELVRQRPDVLESEAQLHQASAAIGVATANMLPQINLTGSYGVEGTTTSNLFDTSVWSLAAGVTQPLLHFGELNDRRRAAIAAYDQAAAQYRYTVLQAFQNVADSLRAIDQDAQTLNAQADAVDSAHEALRLAEIQLKLGAIGSLTVLIAQQQDQQASIGYLQALAARYQDTAALFQSLGGGLGDVSMTVSRR